MQQRLFPADWGLAPDKGSLRSYFGKSVASAKTAGLLLVPMFFRSVTIDPAHAQMLLLKCNGDEIWDVDTCRSLGVPESWIEELQDCFESGFDTDANTIYHQDRLVNQYEGVHDLQLACKLADYLGIDHRRVTAAAFSRQAQVRALQAELDEL